MSTKRSPSGFKQLSQHGFCMAFNPHNSSTSVKDAHAEATHPPVSVLNVLITAVLCLLSLTRDSLSAL